MVQRYVFYLKTRNVSSKFSTFFHWEIGYNLRHEHISEDGNGNLWIVKPREKTNNLCNTPLLSISKQILDKYKDTPHCMDKETLLLIPRNQKMNSFLKEIANLCGIKKNLTTHQSRHSFAPVIALANNVSLPNVAKMLEHSFTRMTQHYAKVLNQTILKDTPCGDKCTNKP